MSELYQTELYQITKQLHETVQAKAEKFGKDLNLQGEFYIAKNSAQPFHWCMQGFLTTVDILVIEPPQIKQILIAFEKEINTNIVPDRAVCIWRDWCCGFPESRFEKDPVRVLTELNEVLNKL